MADAGSPMSGWVGILILQHEAGTQGDGESDFRSMKIHSEANRLTGDSQC